MTDNIQTVQIEYAEAMEMLWRQSQTIKRLHQENEKLRAALKPLVAELDDCPNDDYEHALVSFSDLRAAAVALKETGE